MGVVEMGTGGSYKFQGNTITQIAYCLYCDKCGSFNIGKRPTLKMVNWILVAALIVILFSKLNGSANQIISPISWFACFSVLLLFMGMIGLLELGHRCKRCGNTHITMNNVMNYPANDRNILDVPYERTIKYYLDDY